MTVAVANVANTNTFLFWQTVTNQLAGVISTAAITTTANSSSAQTAGNAAISGTFFANQSLANTLIANSLLTVGSSTANVQVSGSSVTLANSTVSVVIAVPTSAQSSNGQYYLNANGQWAPVVSSALITGTVTTTGTATQLIDQWPIATYRSAEYQVNVSDNNANNHYATKIFTMHDTASGYITEYSQLTSNSSVGTFSVAVASGNVNLNFTPVSSSTAVRYSRVAI